MHVLRRFWPILLLLAAIAAAWASGLTQQLSWATLARNQAALIAWVASHPVIAPSLYLLIYAVAVLLSLPEVSVGDGGRRAAVRHPARRYPGGPGIVGRRHRAVSRRPLPTGGRRRRPPRQVPRRHPPEPATRRVQLSAGHPSGACLPLLAGQPRGSLERHAAAAVCRRHGDRGHARPRSSMPPSVPASATCWRRVAGPTLP